MSEYEMSVREKDKRGGQEKSFHSKAGFRSTKDVAVLRIFRHRKSTFLSAESAGPYVLPNNIPDHPAIHYKSVPASGIFPHQESSRLFPISPVPDGEENVRFIW